MKTVSRRDPRPRDLISCLITAKDFLLMRHAAYYFPSVRPLCILRIYINGDLAVSDTPRKRIGWLYCQELDVPAQNWKYLQSYEQYLAVQYPMQQ